MGTVALFVASLMVGFGLGAPSAAEAAKKKPKVVKWQKKPAKPKKGTAFKPLCAVCSFHPTVKTDRPETMCHFGRGVGGKFCFGTCFSVPRGIDNGVSQFCDCNIQGECDAMEIIDPASGF